MARRYYDNDGNINEKVFKERLEEIHNEVDGTPDIIGLKRIRAKLYRLKQQYEKCGRRFLDCEYEIVALNEIIAEVKK